MPSILYQLLARGAFSPTTLRNYERIIARWLAFAGEEPANWTRPRAQEFYDSLLASGIAVNTANVYIASLRYVSHWYATREARPDLDFMVMQTHREEAPKQRLALDEETARLLIESCQEFKTPFDRRDLVLFVLGLETGMRRMSLSASRFEKLKTQRDYPVLNVPIKGDEGKASFAVPLSDLVIKVIERWRAWLGGPTHGPLLPRFDRRVDDRGRTAYAPILKGPGIGHTMIHKAVGDRAQALGLPHLHPHILRHTFITWRQIAGHTGVQIASITGHKAVDPGFNNMKPYIDMTAVGAGMRNTTPPWLADLVLKGLP